MRELSPGARRIFRRRWHKHDRALSRETIREQQEAEQQPGVNYWDVYRAWEYIDEYPPEYPLENDYSDAYSDLYAYSDFEEYSELEEDAYDRGLYDDLLTDRAVSHRIDQLCDRLATMAGRLSVRDAELIHQALLVLGRYA